MFPERSTSSAHGLLSCAAVAAPPSPVNPAAPVPAIVEIVNAGGACARLAAGVSSKPAPARMHATVLLLQIPPVPFFLINRNLTNVGWYLTSAELGRRPGEYVGSHAPAGLFERIFGLKSGTGNPGEWAVAPATCTSRHSPPKHGR